MNINELFTCPDCGEHHLEEIMENAHACSQIKGIDVESGEIEYGEMSADDGEVTRYQCTACGYVVAESHETLCIALQVAKDVPYGDLQ